MRREQFFSKGSGSNLKIADTYVVTKHLLKAKYFHPSLNRNKQYRNINLLTISYARGLTLGADLPPAEEPSRGTLGFSEHWILTNVFATQADILTSTRTKSILYIRLVERSSTYKHNKKIKIFDSMTIE